MKYAILKIVNGNFFIHSEHGTNKDGAIMEWHNVCRTLRNDSATQKAVVKLVNDDGDLVEGYYEMINRETASAEEA